MRTPILHCVILAAAFFFSLPALAGVGATNSGVTTTIPNQDPTQPSADVQSQSSGFVQQNQQLANQQNQARTGQGGIALPGGVAQSGNRSGTASAGNPANPNSAQAGSGTPAAAPQTPPPPPPPPPVYQSVIKPVVRDPAATDDAPVGTAIAAAATPASAVPPPPAPVPVTPPPAHQAAPTQHAAPAKTAPKQVADNSTKAALMPPANTGGRGSAPDDYTFLLGLLVAGALLAFAVFTYLRIGRSGSNNS